MEQKLVSVIMPTYNCGNYIEKTIESVIQQSYTNWELIIVDDCSKDNTENIIKNLIKNDSRIQYYRLKENQGAAIARTTAMKKAKAFAIATW